MLVQSLAMAIMAIMAIMALMAMANGCINMAMPGIQLKKKFSLFLLVVYIV